MKIIVEVEFVVSSKSKQMVTFVTAFECRRGSEEVDSNRSWGD